MSGSVLLLGSVSLSRRIVFFVFSYGLVCPYCKVMEWCAFLPLLAVGISV